MGPMPKFNLTLIMLTATLGAAEANAQPNVVCTTDPIIFGNAARFELQGGYMGWARGTPKWEYEWIVGNCDTGFKSDQNAGTVVNYNLLYPGTLKVRCTVEYNNGSGGQKATFKPLTSITVPPSD